MNIMNKLLNPISWSAYLESIAVLAIAYYAFIGWKYYRPQINKIVDRLKGESGDTTQIPQVLQYDARDHAASTVSPEATQPASHEGTEIAAYHEPAGALRDLGQALIAEIGEAGGKPYAPAALIPRLKKILKDYPVVSASHQRDEINALIVRECEKTGTALLSESEVDMWWSA